MANNFQPKITSARFVVSPFSPQQMQGLGEVFLSSMFGRWDRAENVYDLPAKPLGKGYAIQKSKLRRGNRRNLKSTSEMRAGIHVLAANENRVVIGADDPVIDQRIAFNNARDRQFGASPKDLETVTNHVRDLKAVTVKTSAA